MRPLSGRIGRQGRVTARTIFPLAVLAALVAFAALVRPVGHADATGAAGVPVHAALPARAALERRKDLETGTVFRCTVTGVHDGDGPIYCREGIKIRLAAIAARELDESCRSNQPCPAASGASARAALDRLTAGHVLRCEKTGMSYARVTAWCWTEDRADLNCAMVRNGAALPWPKYDPFRRLCSPRNTPPAEAMYSARS